MAELGATRAASCQKVHAFKEDVHPDKLSLETTAANISTARCRNIIHPKRLCSATGSRVFKEGHTFLGWTETNAPSDTNYITEIPRARIEKDLLRKVAD